MEESAREEYYLRVVKKGEEPAWPVPSEELVVGNQDLEDDFAQYWAYPKMSGKSADALPPAEVMAQEHKSANPAILVDKGLKSDPKSEGYLELYLVKDGHAWARNSSNLDNLEDNISAVLDFAREEFNIKIEHFMTTSKVPQEAEQRLDDLEGSPDQAPESSPSPEEDAPQPFKNMSSVGVGSGKMPTSGIYSSKSSSPGSSKKWVFLPILIILAILGGLIFFKGEAISTKILPKIPFLAPAPTLTPTPIPSPTPTPTPSIDRSKFKVRVLNGTTTIGAAGKLLGSLKEKGWDTLSAGNAPKQTVEQTGVSGKEGNEEAIELLISDLAPDLEATSSSTTLKSTDKADLEVVIGKK